MQTSGILSKCHPQLLTISLRRPGYSTIELRIRSSRKVGERGIRQFLSQEELEQESSVFCAVNPVFKSLVYSGLEHAPSIRSLARSGC